MTTAAASNWTIDTDPRLCDDAVVRLPAIVRDALRHDGPSGELDAFADEQARRIDERPHGITIRLGQHTGDADVARAWAHRLAFALRAALVRRGAPDDMDVELDVAQESQVRPGQQYRTLLPHHDGGNASFLSPSALDDPQAGPALRRTSPPTVTTTRRHKMYQGFFLRAAGDFASVTTYYDLLAMARVACRRAQGTGADTPDVARWLGDNLRRTLALIEARGGSYVTLGGMLGSRDHVQCLTAVHLADAQFSEAQLTLCPELRAWQWLGDERYSPTEQLFDSALMTVLGHGWPATRERYEVGVPGADYDLMMGHNITLLHGGWRGGRGRIIEPICFTLGSPAGAAYEQWLWRAWRRDTA
jgi:hypothetical protein